MPLTEKEREQLAAIAEKHGVSPEELIAEAERVADEESEPGKNDAAAKDADAPTGAESGAKAHGGRGYFAYEYPFLRVNEVRASLFLDKIEDGELYTGEWLAKHGGGSSSGPAPTE